MSMRKPALFFSGLDSGERVGEPWTRVASPASRASPDLSHPIVRFASTASIVTTGGSSKVAGLRQNFP